MRKLRYALWALAAAALIFFMFLLVRPPANAPDTRPPPQPSGMATFGGPFTLVGADGQPFPSSRLKGRPYAVFFGFTHCPDVCPTTLARMVKLREELGGGDDAFNIVFVTTDPERDGPAEVGKYAALFDSPIIGLTGSPAQIDQVKKQYGIYSEKVPDGSGGYTVDHTASVLLFDGNGQFVATISPEEQDSPALDKLRRIAA